MLNHSLTNNSKVIVSPVSDIYKFIILKYCVYRGLLSYLYSRLVVYLHEQVQLVVVLWQVLLISIKGIYSKALLNLIQYILRDHVGLYHVLVLASSLRRYSVLGVCLNLKYPVRHTVNNDIYKLWYDRDRRPVQV